MNPTARNVSTLPGWKGLRAPWLGTKNIWKLFSQAGVISKRTNAQLQSMMPDEWDEKFCNDLYAEVAEGGFFITNLAKCTQPDARSLPDDCFRAYLSAFEEELSLLQPRRIVTFGNQVSSIVLGQPIKVSEASGKIFAYSIRGKTYPLYPTYYPVGQGFANAPKALANIKDVLSTLN